MIRSRKLSARLAAVAAIAATGALGCKGELSAGGAADRSGGPDEVPGAGGGDQDPGSDPTIERPPGDKPPGGGVLDEVCATVNPGATPLHRLTDTQYQNTIDALFPDLEVDLTPMTRDEKVAHFDANVGVSVVALAAEQYRERAEAIAEAYTAELSAKLDCATERDVVIERAEAESWTRSSAAGRVQDASHSIYSNGSIEGSVTLERSARHRIAIRAWGQRFGSELPRMALFLDGAEIASFEVDALSDNPKVYRTTVELEPGTHFVQVAFTNDASEPGVGDRNLEVDWTEFTELGRIEGDRACAEVFIDELAPRAWRRPLEAPERDALIALFDQVAAEDGFVAGSRALIEGMLQATPFLYRIEQGAQSEEPIVALTDYELASRLSYFLWESPPDDELMRAAAAGELSKVEGLKAQAERMIADERARPSINRALIQLLGLDHFVEIEKEDEAWTPQVRAALKDEMLALIDDELWGSGSGTLSGLLRTEEYIVSEATAELYGVTWPEGAEGTQRLVPEDGRRGLLAHPALLARYGYGDKVIHRGLFVRETFFCSRPGAPPDELIDPPETFEGQSERSKAHGRLEHPTCGGCHASMDPPGLIFEEFDAVGRRVSEDEHGNPVSGLGGLWPQDLRDAPLDGVGALTDALAEAEQVTECLRDQALTYGIGRPPGDADACSSSILAQAAEQGGDRVVDLFVGVVMTDAFRYRRRPDSVEGGN